MRTKEGLKSSHANFEGTERPTRQYLLHVEAALEATVLPAPPVAPVQETFTKVTGGASYNTLPTPIPHALMSRLMPLLPFSPSLLPTLLPSPTPASHKGSSLGRFATIGGSPEYFGALGYASRGVLNTGADMCSAFTMGDETGRALRSFDLTAGDVMCYSGKPGAVLGLNDVRYGLTGVVVGPGLGRSEESQDWAQDAMYYLSPLDSLRSVIVDADGLWPSQYSTPKVRVCEGGGFKGKGCEEGGARRGVRGAKDEGWRKERSGSFA